MARVLGLLALASSAAAFDLTLYYETNCPFCQNFINTELGPALADPAWAALININMIPYGNAVGTGAACSCQHGADECTGNKIHACAKKLMPQPQFNKFVVAFEEQLVAGQTSVALAQNLASLAPGQAAAITACAGGAEGDAEIAKMAALTDQFKATVQGWKVPFVSMASAPTYNLFGQSLTVALSAEKCGTVPCPPPILSRRLNLNGTIQV